MEKEYIIDKLNSWMINFVEKPNPLLGDWSPCPYARQARVNNKIYIDFEVSDIHTLLPLLETYDVLIICYDHNKIPAEDFRKYAADLNKDLLEKNYVVLEDHPDAVECINTLIMNFGECALLLIQKRDKLSKASEQLKNSGYYSVWSEENLNEVVNWR
jgi:hypothetical protein